MTPLKACLFASALVFLTTACSPPTPTQWREDVLLSDGRTLQIERVQEWKVTQPLGSSKSFLPEETEIRFQGVGMPSDWVGFAEKPLVLDVDKGSGEFQLVSMPSTCERYQQVKRPRPPYREFRFRQGRWVVLANLSPNLIGRAPNLLVTPKWQDEIPHIAVLDKAFRNRGGTPYMAYRDKAHRRTNRLLIF